MKLVDRIYLILASNTKQYDEYKKLLGKGLGSSFEGTDTIETIDKVDTIEEIKELEDINIPEDDLAYPITSFNQRLRAFGDKPMSEFSTYA